mgnify:CR=1 FL=1
MCVGSNRQIAPLDGLDLGVGRELHIGRTEERGAGVATRHGHDHVVHRVLNEWASDHDADILVEHLIVCGNLNSIVELDPRLALLLPFLERLGLDRSTDGHLGLHCTRHVCECDIFQERRFESLLPLDAHVLVAFLVVDHHVARVPPRCNNF